MDESTHVFERRWREPGAAWEQLDEAEARRVLANAYVDVDLTIMALKEGAQATTGSADYRAVKVESDPGQLVGEDEACPKCGNRAMDTLIFIGESDWVRCHKCGQIYDPLTGETGVVERVNG